MRRLEGAEMTPPIIYATARRPLPLLLLSLLVCSNRYSWFRSDNLNSPWNFFWRNYEWRHQLHMLNFLPTAAASMNIEYRLLSVSSDLENVLISCCPKERNNTIPPNKNPPAAKCFSEKSTNCYLFTRHLVGFWIKHFAVGGFFESALRSWIFIRRDRIAPIDTRRQNIGNRRTFKWGVWPMVGLSGALLWSRALWVI